MKLFTPCALRIAACVFTIAACSASIAQAAPESQNVLQLSAQGTVEVQQDLLGLSLNATRDGTDAATVQAQLKTALETALNEAKKTAMPGQMDVRTGQFGLYPRYGTDGRINGWQGNAELVLEGRDFPRITQAAARIQSMTMGNVSFGLSREQRAKVEGEAQSMAIERFKSKASELSRSFGFNGYTLREVSVNANDQGFPQPMRMLSARAKSADAQLPVEAGRSTVIVTVSGSVQMR
ncbi:MAG: SIMPL domain-containing protein [Ramlibacter sp.]|nr:SIMPL domain-containing protein [Ramlibacter sp.]